MSETDVSEDDPVEGLAEDLSDLEIIVVHDPIRTMNGGIDVISNIARFLEAPIYTLRQLKDPEPIHGLEVKEIEPGEPLLTKLASKAGFGRLLDLPRALTYQDWEPPRSADVIVTTGTRSQHVIQHPEQHHIHFFNTPARWLWDLSHEQYADYNRVVRWMMLAFADQMRKMDVTSVDRFDRIVANSDLVRERIQAYYNRDADVAYCPVDTYEFEWQKSEGYFVVLTRIVPKKRIKLIIEAFNDLDAQLKIAGTATPSSEQYAEECKRMAEENIEFHGWVDGEEKKELLANASGLVFAGEHEDFGMPPVEAMASGKPVVGVNEGFTKYQITDCKNGVLFEPNVESLRAAIMECRNHTWDSDYIQKSSREYDTRKVRKRWMDIVREITARN